MSHALNTESIQTAESSPEGSEARFFKALQALNCLEVAFDLLFSILSCLHQD
jgi:hypothetical protein